MSSGSLSSQSSASCQSGEVSVALTKTGQENFITNYTRGYRLTVVCTEACGMEKEIFRYTIVRQLADNTNVYELSGVCTWPDMENYPKYTPDPEADPQIVRLDTLDVVVDTEEVADDAWEVIQEEVQRLVDTIKNGQVLSDEENITITGA